MRIPLLAVACVVACGAVTGLPRAEARRDAVPLQPDMQSDGVAVSATYASSVLVFKVGEITLDARFSRDSYSADSFIEASGLAALFTDFDIHAEVAGARSGLGPQPDRYAHVERTGRKVRTVDVDLTGAVAESVARPPFGSWGEPPASDADRTGVIDPMSAFFALSDVVAGRRDHRCEGRIPVFDGKARYDLRLEDGGHEPVRTRAWRGEAIVCRAFYEPISGYDPEDYPSDDALRHPLVIWLAEYPDAGIYMPVRLHTRAGFGGVTIEATRLDVHTAGRSLQ